MCRSLHPYAAFYVCVKITHFLKKGDNILLIILFLRDIIIINRTGTIG